MKNENSDDFSYIETVEEMYIHLKRHGLMLSPRELKEVEKWKNSGIPINIVLKGIWKGIKDYIKKNPLQKYLPRTIKYYHPFIISEINILRAQGYDVILPLREERGVKKSDILKKMEKSLRIFRDEIAKEKNPLIYGIYKEVYGHLIEFFEKEKNNKDFYGILEKEILKLESFIIQRFLDSLGKDERDIFYKDVEKITENEGYGIGEIAKNYLREKTIKRLLSERFKLNIELLKKICEIKKYE